MNANDIAIIGMGCLFPGAPNLDAYWQNIVSKVDAISDPPPGSWDTDTFYDPHSTRNDRIYCQRGGYISPTFNPLSYKIMPRAVPGGEPDQWLALKVAHEALLDAGYDEGVPNGERTAVILGKGSYINRGNLNLVQHGGMVDQTINLLKKLHPEYSPAELETLRAELKASLPPLNPDTVSGLIPNITAGRIANRLNLMGPSYTVDGACASSLIAVDQAMRELQSGRCDLALVGGVHIVNEVPILLLFSQLGALSRQEQIRPFDINADGTLLGEGAGMMVLKRRVEAERDGDRIYALIKGVGLASDGQGLSVTAPRLEGEVLALRRAYEQAGLSPRTVGLIEAHGTGTAVGDATEIQALARVFAEANDGASWVALGTVKSMIGHLMPAAGIAGLIKTALALYHKVLPPTLHIEQPNPQLALETSPFYLNTETRPWIHGRGDAPRRAGVNAFGFGGINAHVVLEEAASQTEAIFQSRNPHWEAEALVLAADSRSKLIERATWLYQLLKNKPAIALKDLAFSLNVPFPQGKYRLGLVAHSLTDLETKLEKAIELLAKPKRAQIKDAQGVYFFEEPPSGNGQLAFLFPGEGSQYLNMLADLCMHFPLVRTHFEAIDRVFATSGRALPSEIIFPRPAFTEAERQQAAERIWHMEGAVQAVLSANRALFELLSQLDIQPDCLLGHSTGEYSAMLAAGMIKLDGPDSLKQFALGLNDIYQQAEVDEVVLATPMLAVAAAAEKIAPLIAGIEGELHIAMDNCPHQTVIVGQDEAISAALNTLREKGFICERLPFNRPYHTPLFEAYAERLAPFFETWLTQAPSRKTYSATTAAPFTQNIKQARQTALAHWMRPVAFRQTIEAMYQDGVRIFVEVGPKGNLTAFVGDILRGKPHLAVSSNAANRSGLNQLCHMLALLAAQGIAMNLEPLYRHRSPQQPDLNAPPQPLPIEPALETGSPMMRLSDETIARLQKRSQSAPASPQPATLTEQPTPPASASSSPPDEAMTSYFETMSHFLKTQEAVMQAYLGSKPAQPKTPITASEKRPATTPISVSAPPESKNGHGPAAPQPDNLAELLLKLVSQRTGYPLDMLTLDQDLEAELGIDSIKRVEILGALEQQSNLVTSSDMETLASCKTLGAVLKILQTKEENSPPADTLPFMSRIISLTPGQELVAEHTFDINQSLHLRHHALGRDISSLEPDRPGLGVVPFTLSMEIMAEAAQTLAPEQTVIGLRDVRGHRWLTLEESTLTVKIVAQRDSAGPEHYIQVQIYPLNSAGDEQIAVVEGTVVLADAYPPAPLVEKMTLRGERPSRWKPEALYRELMFHGPAFQGVQSVDSWAEDGARATLQTKPDFSNNDFLLDPILLDQPGQVVGFWLDEQAEDGCIAFPFHLQALHLYGPPFSERKTLTCDMKITQMNELHLRSDLNIVRDDGRLWAAFTGWEDRRFDVPRSLVRLLLNPKKARLSAPHSAAKANLPSEVQAESRQLRLADFPAELFSAYGAIWHKALAQTILSPNERQAWGAQALSDPACLAWLLGRVVVKEAALEYLSRYQKRILSPADIEIITLDNGRLSVVGAESKPLPEIFIQLLTPQANAFIAIAGNQPVKETVIYEPKL